jgi:hypothetical protein
MQTNYQNCRFTKNKLNKNTLRKVTDLFFERQLIKDHAHPTYDLLLHPLNFTKKAVFQLDAKQLDLKRYLQWS